MRGIFALGDRTVMTADAITGDTHVTVAGAHPDDRVVTVIAGIPAHRMPGIFPLGNHTVVATLTTADHGNVVNSKYVGPCRGRMTNLALSDDAYMPAGRSAGLYST